MKKKLKIVFKNGTPVEYVITHSAPDNIQYKINSSYQHDGDY